MPSCGSVSVLWAAVKVSSSLESPEGTEPTAVWGWLISPRFGDELTGVSSSSELECSAKGLDISACSWSELNTASVKKYAASVPDEVGRWFTSSWFVYSELRCLGTQSARAGPE